LGHGVRVEMTRINVLKTIMLLDGYELPSRSNQ